MGLNYSSGEGGTEEGILVRDELEYFEGTGDSVWQRRGREEARSDLGILDDKNYVFSLRKRVQAFSLHQALLVALNAADSDCWGV